MTHLHGVNDLHLTEVYKMQSYCMSRKHNISPMQMLGVFPYHQQQYF